MKITQQESKVLLAGIKYCLDMGMNNEWMEGYLVQEIDKLSKLHQPKVSVSLPTVDDAGIIAVEISEINNEMTAQEQSLFIAGFSECIKYLEMQRNEH